MSKEILDAVRALAAEKNISSEKLMVALEDALLSAYKKTPGAAPYAQVEMDRDLGDFTVWELKIPEELEAQLLKEQEEEAEAAAAENEGADRERRPGDGRSARGGRARARPREAEGVRGPDRARRRHARRLRPHRRADGEAGDPPADPRSRARHDVRGVPRPRRRADHRHRPAVRLALHARAAARARRGAAAEVRAGRRRALRPLAAHQGGHQGRLGLDEGPEHHRLAAATRS